MTATPYSLEGLRILVTGASSGIGRAIAVQASQLGASVVLTARRGDALRETRDMLHPGAHHVEPIDLGQTSEIEGWMTTLAAQHGPLDGLVHAAGLHRTMPIRGTSVEMVRDIFSINLDAALFLAKAFRQPKVCRKPASICMIGSVVACKGYAGLSAYSASKGALAAMCRSLAVEFAKERIRVNLVAPGVVRTPMTELDAASTPEGKLESLANEHPLGLGEPADVAHAVNFLIGPASRWITGAHIAVDGGFGAR